MAEKVGEKISDAAVRKATGKGWQEWFKLLDGAGAAEMGHKTAAQWLNDNHDISGWWSQMVTVQYERERGLRDYMQRSKGFGVSVQRTIAVPLSKAWNAWADAGELAKWFKDSAEQDFHEGGRYRNAGGDCGEFRRIVHENRIRLTWENPLQKPGSIVEVSFEKKGASKTSVRLQHEQLSSREEADELKTGWSWALDSLKSYLETGKRVAFDDWKSQSQR